MYSKYRKIAVSLAVLNCSLLSLDAGAAIVLEQELSVDAGTEYHSNIQFLDKGEESVYLFTIVPKYRISALDGKNVWFGEVGLSAERSSNHTVSGDREDPFGKIGWVRTLESGSIGLAAEYAKESSRSTQFTQTGLLAQDGTAVTRSITADWKHALTEKFNLGLTAEYQKIKYSNISELSDYDTRYFGSKLMYKLNEKINPYAKIGLNDFRASSATDETNDRIEYQEYLMGAMVKLSPKFSVDVSTGVTHFSQTGDNDWVGAIAAEYLGEKSSLTGSLKRDVYPTGINLVELGDTLTVGYNYKLSERSRWGVALGLSQNSLDNDAQEVSGFYSQNLSQSWLMRLSVALRNLESKDQNSVDDASVGIVFTYNTPKF